LREFVLYCQVLFIVLSKHNLRCGKDQRGKIWYRVSTELWGEGSLGTKPRHLLNR